MLMKGMQWISQLTEHSFGFVELAPTDDGAQAAVADVLAGRREADGSDVVAEADRLFHAQDGYVVDESRVHVARMDEDVRYDAHLLVRRQQIRSATQCTQTGHPVFILSTNFSQFIRIIDYSVKNQLG